MPSKNGGKKLKKITKTKSLKKLKKEAEELVHRYVRERALDFRGYAQCYTCRKDVPKEQLNAGHRHHNKLDLDLRNLKAQCIRCNNWLHGNLGEYERHLIEDYGLEWATKLKQDADRDKGIKDPRVLEEIIEAYKLLLQNL